MIVEVRKNKPQYGRYFLSVEAPGDEANIEEQDVTPVPKANTKIITIKPRKSRLNFADGADIEDDINNEALDEAQPIDAMASPVDQLYQNNPFDQAQPVDFATPIDQTQPVAEPVDTSTEPTVQEIDPLNPTQPDLGNTAQPVNFADGADIVEPVNSPVDNLGAPPVDAMTPQEAQPVDQATPVDNGEAQPVDQAAPVEGDTGVGPDLGTDGNEEDFTAGAEDTTGEDQGGTTPTDTSVPGDKKGPGLEYDSTRKYSLFQNFMSLINAIDNYIERLEGYMNDDYELNKVIKTAIDKMRELRELTYDYLMMKFEMSSYIQSLIFYQNQVVMVQLIFNMLARGQKISQKLNSNK